LKNINFDHFLGKKFAILEFFDILNSKSVVKLGSKNLICKFFPKIEFLDKKWRFGTVCDDACQSRLNTCRSTQFLSQKKKLKKKTNNLADFFLKAPQI